MSKQALFSKHIVLTSASSIIPVAGIILIQDGTIHDVIPVDPSAPIPSILDEYREWSPEDLSDYYISPGIIDLSLRTEWESFAELTKAAISGGVTFALTEQGYYTAEAPHTELFCDIGKVARVDPSSLHSVPLLAEQGFFAAKAYLFPPACNVNSISESLPSLVQALEATGLSLIVDPTLPDEQMLHSVSPFRLRELEDRLSRDIKETQSFGGAFPDLIDLDSNDDLQSLESKDSPEKKLSAELEGDCRRNREEEEENKDSVSPLMPNLFVMMNEITPRAGSPRRRERSYSEDIVTNAKTTSINSINLDDQKYNEENAQGLRPRIFSNELMDELDKRIRNSQLSIRDLSTAEYSTYKQAGVTQFLSPSMISSASLDTSHSNASDHSSNSSISLTSPSSIFQRRKLFSSLSLVVKPIMTPRETGYYHHMACYSHTWELAGISKVIQALNSSRCRVHFSGISAAASFNMIRKAKDLNPYLTSEIPASHLYFSSVSIPDSDTRFKCSPPIRSHANTALLWDLLKVNCIDAIGSGHCCIDPEYKRNDGDFTRAVNGMPCVEFSLQAVWSKINSMEIKGVEKEQMIVQMGRWFSKNPAEILGVGEKRGGIEKGKLADLVVWKPYEQFIASADYSPFPQMSPFVSMKVSGKIYKVYLRGQIAYSQGNFLPKGKLCTMNNN